MSRCASFRNRLILSAGLALTLNRPYATVNTAGAAIAAGAPFFEAESLFAGPPVNVVTLSTTASGGSGPSNVVMGTGTWSAGEAVTVQYLNSTGASADATLIIRVASGLAANSWDTIAGLPAADQARVKNIGFASGPPDALKGSGAAYGEDAAVRHVPTNGVVFRGLVLLVGYMSNTTGSSFGGMWVAKWNEGAGRFEKLYGTPAFNTSVTKGNNWIRPKINFVDPVATANKAYVTCVDYSGANAGNTVSGTMLFFKIYGAVGAGPWECDAVIELAQPDYDTTAAGGGTQTHNHSEVVRRYGASGLIVGMSVGHDVTHSFHLWARDDENYTQGYAQSGASVTRTTASLGAQGINPTSAAPVASKVDGATQNGWTCNRYAAGDLTTTPVMFNPQFMSMEPMENPSEFLVTTDEAAGPCSIATMPATITDKIKVRRCNDTGFNSFRGGHVAWGLVRPDQAAFTLWATMVSSDNITTTAPPNVASRPIASGAITRSGTTLTVLIPGANIPPNATIAVSGLGGGDAVWNATHTAISGSGPGVLVATVANSGPTTSTSAGVAAVTYTQRTVNTKVKVSLDGKTWAEVYAPGTDCNDKSFVLGWHGPNTLIVGVNTKTNYQLRAVTLPALFACQPVAVSPAVKNFAINTVTFGSFGGTNTLADVTATYTNADALVTGHTVPPVPSNGRVLLATARGPGSNAICADVRWMNGTTKSILLAENRARVGFWVYLLPTATGWTTNTTPPYNNYITPYFGIRFEDSSGSPITGQLNVGGGRIDATGWHFFEFEFDAATSAELSAAMVTGPLRFYVRLQTSGGTGKYAQYLLCCDHICAGATCDPPTIPPPCGAGTTSTEQDMASVDGWSCGANWSKVLRLMVSPRGWDSYTKASYRTANRRLLTLFQSASPSKYIAVTVDTVNGRLTFTDGTNTATIGPTSPEIFEFNFRSPITIGITKTDAGSGNSTMAFYVSVGGSRLSTTLVSGSLAWTSSDVRPTRTVLSDPAISPCDGICLVDDWTDESNVLNATDLAATANRGLVPVVAGSRPVFVI